MIDHEAWRAESFDELIPGLLERGYRVKQSYRLPGVGAQSVHLVHTGALVDRFISVGEPGSVVAGWVSIWGTGRHHIAFAVEDFDVTMAEWEVLGYEFDTQWPIRCPCDHSLIQVFTKPITGGFKFELINAHNGHDGFCERNVEALMAGSAGDA